MMAEVVDTENLMRLMERILESLVRDLGEDAPFVRGFRFATETVKTETERYTRSEKWKS